jgi:hypothetical protein
VLRLFFEPSQPFLGIFQFRNPWVGVLPEVEEFLIVLNSLGPVTLLFRNLAEYVKGPGVDVTLADPALI